MASYYDKLNVGESASAQEIKEAYRRLAKELHPDIRPNDPEAHRRFKEIGEAYNTLKDQDRRAEYDAKMKVGAGAGYSTPPPEEHTQTAQSARADEIPPDDLVDYAWFLFRERRFEDAIGVAAFAKDRGALGMKAAHVMGRALFELGVFSEAAQTLAFARPLFKAAEDFYVLGTAYSETGAFTLALEVFTHALSLFPHETMLLYGKAICHMELLDAAKAVAILEQAFERSKDEDIKDALAVGYITAHLQSLWMDPKSGNHAPTSIKDLEKTAEVLRKVKALNPSGAFAKEAIRDFEEEISRLTKRIFVGDWKAAIFLGLFYIVPGILYILSMLRPNYKINGDYRLNQETGAPQYPFSAPPGIKKMLDKWETLMDRQPFWALLTYKIIAAPVFILWGLIDNWKDFGKEQALKSL